MLEMITDMPDYVLAVNAKGIVTGEDYDRVLVPAIEERLGRHRKIRMLYQLGEDFTHFTGAAMWDDARIGIKHLTAFEKVAVVSDLDWIATAVRIFAFVMPCPVRVFANDQLQEAKNWVRQ